LPLEDFSLSILASSLAPEQEVGLFLQFNFQVLLRWVFKWLTDYLRGNAI